MALEAAVGEDPGVDARVERLDAAVEALGEAGQLLDPRHREAETLDQGRGAAGGDQLDTGVVQGPGQLLQTRLVVDGDEGATDRDARV